MEFFEIETNYRTFQIEAAGIGDAIDRVLNYPPHGRRGHSPRGADRHPHLIVEVAA
jgi:hypothetical protein